MLELTKQEAANVEIKTTPQGTQPFQLPQHMQRQTGPNRPRKDNYSTLVLGNWMNKIYHEAMEVEEEEVPEATFTPSRSSHHRFEIAFCSSHPQQNIYLNGHS